MISNERLLKMGKIFILHLIIIIIFSLFYMSVYYLSNETFNIETNEDEKVDKASNNILKKKITVDVIFKLLYFSAITNSTIGYGEYYPRTIQGRLLVLFNSLIIMTNFLDILIIT